MRRILPFIFVISFPCWTLDAAEAPGDCSDLLSSPVKKWDGTSDMLTYMDDLLANRKIKNPKLDLEYVDEGLKLGEVRNPIRKENRELSPRNLYHHDQLQKYIQNPELLNQEAIQTWVEKKLQVREKIQRQRVVARKKTESLVTSKNICERTKAVRLAIMKALKKSNCSEITDEDLGSITVLNLSKKKITRLEEGDFSGLSALRELSLDYNKISELPKAIFSELSSLERLDLDNNQISELPEAAFSRLSHLGQLNLSRNQIRELPETIFSDLSSLRYLFLGYNKISKLPEAAFSRLSHLRELNLSHNQIRELPETIFWGLSSLKLLYIYGNNINELPETIFSGLSSLRSIDLSNNKISKLPQVVFSGLISLRLLDLNNNKFGILSIFKLHQLCLIKRVSCNM